jgi:hypothetical protein
MLDQSFSAKNFEEIFNIRNRTGKIEIATMPILFQQIVAEIKQTKVKIAALKARKRTTWGASDKQNFEDWNSDLKVLQEWKIQELQNYLEAISVSVNSQIFHFSMTMHLHEGKNVFAINTAQQPVFYAIKQLQYNIQRTFKVQQANRHAIMACLRLLLNTKLPIYIIRTDIARFFESIPQNRLLKMINDNTLLSYKSKAFIRAIFKEFEDIKNTANITLGEGVPRGVGISSLLSEIYMRDLDQIIISRKEVIYYARYVDDIFIILTSLGTSADLNTYYAKLTTLFFQYGLTLKQPNVDRKCELLDFTTENGQQKQFEYLGYKLYLNKVPRKGLEAKYGLSDHKINSLHTRIDNAFEHFNKMSKKNLRIARKDLLDTLNIISGNVKLRNAKSGVKVGLFYNNDLLSYFSDLDDLTAYLQAKSLNPYIGLFKTEIERQDYIEKLNLRIINVDFHQRWNSRSMYDFTTSRMKEIAEWL